MARNIHSTFRIIGSDEAYAADVECMGCRSRFGIQLHRGWTEDGPDGVYYVSADRPFAYCPVCGGHFSGRLDARPQYISRWAWDRFREGDGIRPGLRTYSRAEPSPATGHTGWIIEERFRVNFTRENGEPDEIGEWHDWKREGYYQGSARDIRARLASLRSDLEPPEDRFAEIEYRARLYRA